jgi:hypothetical protein
MASKAAMPWIVLNLGGEMIYVLEQRLKAQAVPPGKAARVLQDVAATLLDRSFLEEKLFVPQETYSLPSTRKIFERLAHSSIMRLSEARCGGGARLAVRLHDHACSGAWRL